MPVSPLIRSVSLRPRPNPDAVGTYFIQTWGCQMNEEDSEQIALYLEAIGFRPAENITEAEVILLNTCSVRKKPEDKAFSYLGEIAMLKATRPEIIVGVCGCMAQLRADEIRRRAPHVDFVIGTAQIAQVPGILQELIDERKFRRATELPERRGAVVTDIPRRAVGRAPKLKSFVPIQYGCDKFCTFCIVPTTRGRERSRPTVEILEEVTALAANGTREVTLLGQTVNSYGRNLAEGRVPFSQLLWLLNDVEGLQRIRYTSPYPRDFKQDLIETIRDCPKVMEHCHIPLQAGDNGMLRAMKRQYTVERFLEIVENLRATVPGITLTTDMIVGFPGETDAQFEATMNVMRHIRFDGAYMFAYSPRPDTPAAVLDAQVPEPVKKERLNAMIAMQTEITVESNTAVLGQTFEVLVEGRSPKNPDRLQGYTRCWRMMHFSGPAEWVGQLVQVRADSAHLWGLSGTAV